MNVLVKFKQKYYAAIRNGDKTQTMRMAHKRLDINVGDRVIALFPNGEELLLEITDRGYKSFKSIDDDDAHREGFQNKDELKKELLEIYNDFKVEDYNRFYYYKFEYLGYYRNTGEFHEPKRN